MAVWPWLKEQLDTGWPTRCPACATSLEVRWLTTTTRPSDGVRRPGIGLHCDGCGRGYEWMDVDGYRLVKHRLARGIPGPKNRAGS